MDQVDMQNAEQMAREEQAALAVAGAEAKPVFTPGSAAQKAEAVLDAYLSQVVGTMLRGILVSTSGFAPDVLVRSVGRVSGRLCASSLQADLVTTMNFRKALKDAFADGVAQAPPPNSGLVGQPQNVANLKQALKYGR